MVVLSWLAVRIGTESESKPEGALSNAVSLAASICRVLSTGDPHLHGSGGVTDGFALRGRILRPARGPQDEFITSSIQYC